MQVTAEHPSVQKEAAPPANLSEFRVALEALRKRQAKHDKAAAAAAQAAAQIEAAQQAAEEMAKVRAAAVVSAWAKGRAELTDAERRKLDEDERRVMSNAYSFDITAEQLPALKAHIESEAAELGSEWAALRATGRRLALENNEQNIEHHKNALSDPRGQLSEIEQHLTKIRDLCAAGEYFRNNEKGVQFIGPRKVEGLNGGEIWVDAKGDPGAIDDKHGVKELLEKYREIAKVSAEVDRKHAWEVASHYAAIGVQMYTREERELECKTYVSPVGAVSIRNFNEGKIKDGAWAAAMRRRIAELDEATLALRALQAKPF